MAVTAQDFLIRTSQPGTRSFVASFGGSGSWTAANISVLLLPIYGDPATAAGPAAHDILGNACGAASSTSLLTGTATEGLTASSDILSMSWAAPNGAQPWYYRYYWQNSATIDFDDAFYTEDTNDYLIAGTAVSATVAAPVSPTTVFLPLQYRTQVQVRAAIRDATVESISLYDRDVNGNVIRPSRVWPNSSDAAWRTEDRLNLSVSVAAIGADESKILAAWRRYGIRVAVYEGDTPANTDRVWTKAIDGIDVPASPADPAVDFVGDMTGTFIRGYTFTLSNAGTANGIYTVKNTVDGGAGVSHVSTLETLDNSTPGAGDFTVYLLNAFQQYGDLAGGPMFFGFIDKWDEANFNSGRRSSPDRMLSILLDREAVQT